MIQFDDQTRELSVDELDEVSGGSAGPGTIIAEEAAGSILSPISEVFTTSMLSTLAFIL